MLLASFDLETTSLDLNQARVIEVGALLYTTTFKRVVMAESFLVDNEEPIGKESSDLTKINTAMVGKFGLTPSDALSRLQNYFDMADTVVGMNILDYDLPVYKNWCLRETQEPIERPTIDIMTDLPGVESKKLAYMAADAGFLNPSPHAALADAWTALRLIESQPDFAKVVERSKSPRVYLKALVTFDTNYLAKERKFKWDPATKTWYKVVKEMDVDQEAKECQFDLKRIQPIISQ